MSLLDENQKEMKSFDDGENDDECKITLAKDHSITLSSSCTNYSAVASSSSSFDASSSSSPSESKSKKIFVLNSFQNFFNSSAFVRGAFQNYKTHEWYYQNPKKNGVDFEIPFEEPILEILQSFFNDVYDESTMYVKPLLPLEQRNEKLKQRQRLFYQELYKNNKVLQDFLKKLCSEETNKIIFRLIEAAEYLQLDCLISLFSDWIALAFSKFSIDNQLECFNADQKFCNHISI
jgi:hypothetical protein